MPRVEFFFDLSSPWTWLAFHNIRPMLARLGKAAVWRPFLVGGVFNAVNRGVYEARAGEGDPKLRHSFRSLHRWADWSGLALAFPSEHHPVRSVHAMRACTALEEDQPALERFAEAAFRAYFEGARNLDDPAVLAEVADGVGIDGEALLARSREDAVKARLRAATDEAIARGAFGSPTIFVDRETMFFGNDQLPLVERALTREPRP